MSRYTQHTRVHPVLHHWFELHLTASIGDGDPLRWDLNVIQPRRLLSKAVAANNTFLIWKEEEKKEKWHILFCFSASPIFPSHLLLPNSPQLLISLIPLSSSLPFCLCQEQPTVDLSASLIASCFCDSNNNSFPTPRSVFPPWSAGVTFFSFFHFL